MMTFIVIDLIVFLIGAIVIYRLINKVSELEQVIHLLDQEQHSQNKDLLALLRADEALNLNSEQLFDAVEFLMQVHEAKNQNNKEIFKTQIGEA